jgi:hypothetical protein
MTGGAMIGRKDFGDFSGSGTFGGDTSAGDIGVGVDFFRLLVLVILGALDVVETRGTLFGTSGTFSVGFVGVVFEPGFVLVDTVDRTDAWEEGREMVRLGVTFPRG